MKKKTMRAIFVLLFIVGIIVGYLLPGDIKTITRKQIKANVVDIPKRLGQLELESPYFKYTVVAETETGSVELLRLDDQIPMHIHPKENHFVYVYKGRAKGTVGNMNVELGPGQMVVIPAGVPHTFERIGDTPVEIIVFSTPPFAPDDTMFMEK